MSSQDGKMTFDRAGGREKVVASAFALADPWKRGHIDRRMAEQAFAQLIMHSDLGLSFSTSAAQAEQIDAATFASLVNGALREHKL